MPRHEILMPRLSDTMTEGTIARWLKQAGEEVSKGEPLAEIDTDKVTMELEAASEGVLQEILAEDGATVSVGAVIGVLSSGAEAASSAPNSPSAEPATAAPGPSRGNGVAAEGEIRQGPVVQPLAGIRATPVARALAVQSGIDLRSLGQGSGPEGRIVKEDVERLLAGREDREAVYAAAPPLPDGDAGGVRKPTRLQATIARRMAESKASVPHFYLDAEVDMEAALLLRDQLKALDPPVEVSITDLVVRACALALRDVPEVNASWIDEEFVFHRRVDVGVAVALDDGGLLVPVVRKADEKQLGELAAETNDFAARCRRGTVTPDEISGSTFTVSSLGMFGVRNFHAIINPPESGILAVGSLERRAVPFGDDIVARARMVVSLSADHRVYSGATGGRFLQAVKARLEQPLALLAHAPAGETGGAAT